MGIPTPSRLWTAPGVYNDGVPVRRFAPRRIMIQPTFTDAQPELSIVVPALDEQDNVAALVEEVEQAVRRRGIVAELIVVDDGSTDQTLTRLRKLAAARAWLVVLHRDRAMGQSAAMYAGIQAARGAYVAMLDADLQNDPADLPAMLEVVRAGQADMAQGLRARRKDSPVRKFSSWVGRTTRSLILGDKIRDTGCTTRVVRSEIARQFPLQYRGMHRFLPIYARLLGARVVEMPVNHRPRVAGTAKYGMLNRGFVGLIDCFAVRWMLRRYRDPAVRKEGSP
jgi:dolichol-phosphate mannosyltransferase